MGKSLKMSLLMKRYYDEWLRSPTLLENPHDQDRFYQFIKACNKYGRKHRSGSWLRSFLENDLKDRFPEDYKQQVISHAVSIFDHISLYETVAFPNPMVELKSRTSVYDTMYRLQRADGSKFYTEQEILDFIKENVKQSVK